MRLVDHAAGETFLGPIRFFRQRTLLGIHASIALGSLIGMGIFRYSMPVVATKPSRARAFAKEML